MNPLQIRAVLSAAANIIRRHLLTFAMLGLIANFHVFFVIAMGRHNTVNLPFALLHFALNQLLVGAIGYITVLELAGIRRNAPIRQSLRVVFTLMLPLLIVGFVSELMLRVAFLHPLIGLVGIFASTALFVSIPALLIEQSGILASLRTSLVLTNGSRWSILGLLGVFVVVAVLTEQILLLFFGEQGEVIDLGYWIGVFGLQLVMSIFGAVVTAVAYARLKASKTS